MEDNSFDPRTWPSTGVDGSLRSDDESSGDEAVRFGATRPGAVFPLATAAALRLWLASALVLAIAAGCAWGMRGQPTAAAQHLAAGQAVAQAPAP